MAASLKEAEVRTGLKAGGQILGAFLVELTGDRGFLVYLRCNWVRGRQFRVLRTWRDLRGDRIFERVEGAYFFVRRLPFDGPITIYPEGDRGLERFSTLCGDDASADIRDMGPG